MSSKIWLCCSYLRLPLFIMNRGFNRLFTAHLLNFLSSFVAVHTWICFYKFIRSLQTADSIFTRRIPAVLLNSTKHQHKNVRAYADRRKRLVDWAIKSWISMAQYIFIELVNSGYTWDNNSFGNKPNERTKNEIQMSERLSEASVYFKFYFDVLAMNKKRRTNK